MLTMLTSLLCLLCLPSSSLVSHCQAALADFRERVRQYEAVYEPVGDSEAEGHPSVGYLKIINAGKKVVAFNCSGSHLLSQAPPFSRQSANQSATSHPIINHSSRPRSIDLPGM